MYRARFNKSRNVRRWQIGAVAGVAVAMVGVGLGVASAAETVPTVDCPQLTALPAVPSQAQAEVKRNLELLNTQIAEANNRLRTSVGQNFIRNAILGPLKDKRFATINRMETAIGRNAAKPNLNAEGLAGCALNEDGGTSAQQPTDVPGAGGSNAGADGNGAGGNGGADGNGAGNNGGAGGNNAGNDNAGNDGAGNDGAGNDGAGNDGAGNDGAGNDGAGGDGALPAVSCPALDGLPAVPAQAQAEVQRNLQLLNTQIAEANARIASSIGQGGPDFIRNTVLGPLADKRFATINRIETAIGRNAAKPDLNAEALAPCTLDD